MSDYKSVLKCNKSVMKNDSIEICGKSPARHIEVLNANVCKEHQKELSSFLTRELGEDMGEAL